MFCIVLLLLFVLMQNCFIYALKKIVQYLVRHACVHTVDDFELMSMPICSIVNIVLPRIAGYVNKIIQLYGKNGNFKKPFLCTPICSFVVTQYSTSLSNANTNTYTCSCNVNKNDFQK